LVAALQWHETHCWPLHRFRDGFGIAIVVLMASGRCYLKGRAGDAANVILSAVGYNLRLVLAWLTMILRVVLLALPQIVAMQPALPGFLTGD